MLEKEQRKVVGPVIKPVGNHERTLIQLRIILEIYQKL